MTTLPLNRGSFVDHTRPPLGTETAEWLLFLQHAYSVLLAVNW